MQLSIIIVNYHASEFIINCINSAMQFSSATNFEWIIVNNDSSDNSKTLLINTFPFLKWIDMEYNAGFARANNAGIKAAKGNIILLLNPDTIVVNDCIEKCFNIFKKDDAIACSAQLINPDGSAQITGNYFIKGGLNHLLPLPYLGKLLRSIAFTFNTKKTNVLTASPVQKVDWINGAFLMVKKVVIEKAGLMDEDFFLYAEESEWCARLGRFGKLIVYGNLKIIHLQGEIINKNTQTTGKGYFDIFTKKGLQLIISNNLRIRKQYGIGWYLINVLMYVIEIPVFFICNFFSNIFLFKNPFNNYKLIIAYSKNIFKLVQLTPRIITNKKYFYKML